MTCHDVQTRLSLYLYGELDFADEEELEHHLAECAFCERALRREKTWHSSLKSTQVDPPLDLLAQCRRDLAGSISGRNPRDASFRLGLSRWLEWFGISRTRWSAGLAAASFLVFFGFALARWIDRDGLRGNDLNSGLAESSLLNPVAVRVRDIQPSNEGGVKILLDQIQQREVTGQIGDPRVRELLLSAIKDSDPGLRVDSLEMLMGQNGTDIRDAFIYSLEYDSNAGVRLKALQGLRSFVDDPATRAALRNALQYDDNPGVRSAAIDVLAPPEQQAHFNPDLAGTLQEVMRSERNDEYLRMRCLRTLQQMNASLDVY